jgi:replicative DNA helicase
MVNKPKVTWQLPDEEVEWEELEAQWGNQEEDNSFMSQVKRGMTGMNEGFDNGLKTINNHIHGTHRGRYYLIGADSGVGKTTIADFMYLYSLWRSARKKGIKLYIKYFSFELSAAEKKAKWVCQWVKNIYNIDLSTDYIMGRIPGLLLSSEHLRLIMRAYAVVEEVMQDMVLVDHMLHPTGMLNKLVEEHYEKIGTVIRDTPKEGKKKGMIRAFKPKDPTDMTVVIVDHLALINVEGGATTTKQIMDRWSMYSVQLRNIFHTTLVQIQQFSTSMMSAYREQKKSETAIAPQRLDFGDSSYTYRDADLVMGLVKPIQYNLKTFMGYNLEDIGQYFIANFLMKNRYGPADRWMPLFMNPLSGMFYDIPASTAYGLDGQPAINYFITEAKRIENVCQQFNSPTGKTQ